MRGWSVTCELVDSPSITIMRQTDLEKALSNAGQPVENPSMTTTRQTGLKRASSATCQPWWKPFHDHHARNRLGEGVMSYLSTCWNTFPMTTTRRTSLERAWSVTWQPFKSPSMTTTRQTGLERGWSVICQPVQSRSMTTRGHRPCRRRDQLAVSQLTALRWTPREKPACIESAGSVTCQTCWKLLHDHDQLAVNLLKGLQRPRQDFRVWRERD